MFAELKPLVAKSALTMMVVGEGDQLRVTISQKKAGKGGRPLNLSVLASPDELDRDLPGSIATAANEVAQAAPVADQVREQVAAAVAAPKKEKKAKPARPAKRAKAKPLKQAKAPKHKAKAAPRPAHKVRLPGASKKPAVSRQPSAPSSDGVKHHASKPGKQACIDDYKAMKAKHGDKLTRELFIDKSETGRRFERLWGMSWRNFVAEAEGSKVKAAAAPAQPRAREPRKPAQQNMDLPGVWPFPDKDKNSAAPRAERASSLPGMAPSRAAAADTDSAAPQASHKGAPTSSGGGEPAAAADSQIERIDTSKPHPPRVVKERDGKLIAGGFTAHVKPGEELTLAGRKWVVVEANERQVIAEWPR